MNFKLTKSMLQAFSTRIREPIKQRTSSYTSFMRSHKPALTLLINYQNFQTYMIYNII